MTAPKDTESGRALLSQAIAATGYGRRRPLSVRQFARFIHRTPRAVYRWLVSGPPGPVRELCAELIALPPEELKQRVDGWIVRDFDRRQRSQPKQEQP